MVNPNTSDFNAHALTYREEDGEIVPNETGVNANKYFSESDRDKLNPHVLPALELGETVLDSVESTIPADIRAIIDSNRLKGAARNSAANATQKYITGRHDVLGK